MKRLAGHERVGTWPGQAAPIAFRMMKWARS